MNSVPREVKNPALALQLASWAHSFSPSVEDLALADRALVDTVAVGLAARHHGLLDVCSGLPDAARWAIACHVLDYDDLHLPSTSHISTVCVPVTLALGGGPIVYLAGAGVMARVGMALGWTHYSAGWHATTTAGVMGAAAASAVAFGLDQAQTANAIALAVPMAGGVQRSFGTDAKALQVGLAAAAGITAAQLAARGANADLTAVEAWMKLVAASSQSLRMDGPAVPGGLGVKTYPACYALQRPISAVRSAISSNERSRLAATDVTKVRVRTSAAGLQPLVHHRPKTGLQGKFSMEYAIAATILDKRPGLDSFSDEAVQRSEAQRLISVVEVTADDDPGDSLLSGQFAVDIHTNGGIISGRLQHPPGSPEVPASVGEIGEKVAECLRGTDIDVGSINWDSSTGLLRRFFD